MLKQYFTVNRYERVYTTQTVLQLEGEKKRCPQFSDWPFFCQDRSEERQKKAVGR